MRRPTRKPQCDDASVFGRWLTYQGRRLGDFWGQLLSDNMKDGTEPAYLTRIAKALHNPGREKTYDIGEGLRAAGIPWCSGLLALYNHPSHRADCYAILEVVSGNPDGAKAAQAWHAAVRSLAHYYNCASLYRRIESSRAELSRLRVPDEELRDVQGALERFHNATNKRLIGEILMMSTIALSGLADAAWQAYLVEGLAHVRGHFGMRHLSARDARLTNVEPVVTTALLRESHKRAAAEVAPLLKWELSLVKDEVSLANLRHAQDHLDKVITEDLDREIASQQREKARLERKIASLRLKVCREEKRITAVCAD